MSMTFNKIIITAVLLFCVNFAIAQTYSKGSEIKKSDVNLTEIANYWKDHPQPITRRMPLDEEEDERRPRQHKPDPSEIHMIHHNGVPTPGNGTHLPDLPVSPAPTDTFQSTLSPGGIIPPDTHGAVDSHYCVTAINTTIRVQTRGGVNIMTAGIGAFWASVLPAGTDPFDPRVHYDHYNNRWIMVTDAVNQTTMGTSTLLVAVSATGDPTGTWHMYSIAVDPSGASWLDFPNVGYNNRWVAITGNMFAGSSGARAYVIDYASMMAGTGAPYTMITLSSSFAVCPAITYDPVEPNLFALETSSGSSGRLRLWKIAGATGSPTMTSVGYPTTTIHWRGSASTGGDIGPQVGTTNKVNLGDDRITNVIFRNNKLWCSHTAFLPSSGTTTHSAAMWWQVDTLANPIQNGIANNPSNTAYYAYPTISVNANDDALIGFAYLTSAIHPSCGYAMHLSSEPLDSIRPAVIYRHGQATYYETFGGSRNRWGDYSGTCIDPRNDTDFWTIQEASVVGSSPNWDTWWANIQFCPKPLAPTILSSPASLCIGATGTYHVVPVSGATNYVWSVSGTGWSSTPSNVDSVDVTIGTGTGTITVVAYNGCGEGETQLLQVTPQTVPAQPTIATVTAACIGSSTATFLVTSSGGTYYSWQAIGTGWSGTGGSTSFTPTVGTGTGMIILTAGNACGVSIPDTIYSTPAVVPVTTFSVGAHVTNVNVNDVITFTGTAPGGSVYNWNFAGGAATPGIGAGPQTVYWTTGGTKTVTLTVDNGGCTSNYSDTVHVIDRTAVSQLYSGDNEVKVIPNPNTGSFKILFGASLNKEVSVTITDMLGRTVYANDYGLVNGKELAVTANNLIPANYTVSINIDGMVLVKKITINK